MITPQLVLVRDTDTVTENPSNTTGAQLPDMSLVVASAAFDRMLFISADVNMTRGGGNQPVRLEIGGVDYTQERGDDAYGAGGSIGYSWSRLPYKLDASASVTITLNSRASGNTASTVWRLRCIVVEAYPLTIVTYSGTVT